MIQKLLDEPHWDTLEKDFTPFYLEFGTPLLRLENGVINKDDCFILVKRYVTYNTYFLAEKKLLGWGPAEIFNGGDPDCLGKVLTVIKDDLPGVSEIIFHALNRHLIEKEYSLNRWAAEISIGLCQNRDCGDAYLKERLQILKGVRSIPDLLKEFTTLCEYKIKSSKAYKELKQGD